MHSGIDQQHLDSAIRVAGRPVRPPERPLAGRARDPRRPLGRRGVPRPARCLRAARARDHRGGRGRVRAGHGGSQGRRPLRLVHGRGSRAGAWPRADRRGPRRAPRRSRTSPTLLTVMARLQLQGAAGGFLAPYVYTDAQASDQYVVYLTQAGLGLPDESYYRQESFEAIRSCLRRARRRMLELAGWSADGQSAARPPSRIMTLETAIAARALGQRRGPRCASRATTGGPLAQVPRPRRRLRAAGVAGGARRAR